MLSDDAESEDVESGEDLADCDELVENIDNDAVVSQDSSLDSKK